MKIVVKLAVLLLAITCVTGAFAADKAVTINSPTNLNGQKIAPGDYKVSYTINGANAEVKFLRGEKVVASGNGKVQERPTPAAYDGVVNRSNDDGTRSVIEIQFANQKSVIRFDTENTAVGK